jgi:hypothetical protein
VTEQEENAQQENASEDRQEHVHLGRHEIFKWAGVN